MPIGMPARPEGRCSRVSAWFGEGKMVLSVPREVRWRIRRPRMADSYAVGMRKVEWSLEGEEGLEKMCWGGEGRMAVAREARLRSWRSILSDLEIKIIWRGLAAEVEKLQAFMRQLDK